MRCCLLQGLGLRVEVVEFRALVRELRRLDSASCVCCYPFILLCVLLLSVLPLPGSCDKAAR